MVKRSVTGWVPANEKEKETLLFNGINGDALEDMINGLVFRTKKDAMHWGKMEPEVTKDFKRVRIVMTVDLEVLP